MMNAFSASVNDSAGLSVASRTDRPYRLRRTPPPARDRRHQIRRSAHWEILEDLDHAVVILEGVHARPGQLIFPGYQIFIERLMHVPEDAERWICGMHFPVCQTAALNSP